MVSYRVLSQAGLIYVYPGSVINLGYYKGTKEVALFMTVVKQEQNEGENGTIQLNGIKDLKGRKGAKSDCKDSGTGTGADAGYRYFCFAGTGCSGR